MRRFLLPVVAVLALGCEGGGGFDAGPDAMVPDPRVELGTGTSAFVPIPQTGGELELVGGPQGGFHVFVTARIWGLEPEGMTLRFSAVDATTGESVGTPAGFALQRARVQREGDHWVRVGDFLILDDGNPDNVRGLTLDITVEAEEAGSGRTATDHRVILVVDEEMG